MHHKIVGRRLQIESIFGTNTFIRAQLIDALAQFLHTLVGDVVIKLGALVDDALGAKFDHAVAHGLDELVVVARHEDHSTEGLQVVVECLDRLEVEVVGR